MQATKTKVRKAKKPLVVCGDDVFVTADAPAVPTLQQTGIITLDFALLETLLPLPIGMKVIGCFPDFTGFKLRVISCELPSVPIGYPFPEIEIECADFLLGDKTVQRRARLVNVGPYVKK